MGKEEFCGAQIFWYKPRVSPALPAGSLYNTPLTCCVTVLARFNLHIPCLSCDLRRTTGTKHTGLESKFLGPRQTLTETGIPACTTIPVVRLTSPTQPYRETFSNSGLVARPVAYRSKSHLHAAIRRQRA